MSRRLVKVCGCNSAEAVDAAMGAEADYVGLVFFPPSPRNVTPADAAALAQRMGSRIGKVGLFVDPDDGLLTEGIAAGRLEVVQLHGSETPERAAQVRARFGLPVWKVISVSSAADVARAGDYRTAADLILFDAKTPKGGLPGGMGLAFDWSLLAAARPPLPWGLAGGLSADNVADAIRATGAPLVDASSSLESAPGVKDAGKIRAFVQAARST